MSSPTFIVCLYGSGGAPTKRPSASPERPPPAMTSGNESEAPAVTGGVPQNGENKPPQAIVKPQVLTHVIEGFVIQEGAEPFPVCVSVPFPPFQRKNEAINKPRPPRQRAPQRTPAGGAVSSVTTRRDSSQLLWDSVINYTGHWN